MEGIDNTLWLLFVQCINKKIKKIVPARLIRINMEFIYSKKLLINFIRK